MSKILLLDFDEEQRDYLVSRKYDVELKATGWKSGKDEALEVPDDSDVIFYQLTDQEGGGRADLHAGVHDEIARRVADGLRVVCFIGAGEIHRLTNVIGTLPGLELQDNPRGESIVFNPRALFHIPFERFRPFLSKAYKLLSEPAPDGVWERNSTPEGTLEILAKSADHYPVSLLVKRGKGYYLLLPSFGAKNVEIAESILNDKLPLATEPAAAETDWVDAEEFVFPEMKELLAKRDEENERHSQALGEIDRQIKNMRAAGQEEFHRLLKADGAELRQAVIHSLRYLGWGKVVDVDEYWKKVIRNKEEDAWLIENDGPSVEASLHKEGLVIVLVRSGKAWATDDECALLQKFKGRRMQEFDNTKMKAMLIGNYFSAADPRTRGNPYSAVQAEEARKDGNGLLTTYELFKAIKAEKEGRVSKATLRGQVKEKAGLITFEF
jgi:hypothetical protein